VHHALRFINIHDLAAGANLFGAMLDCAAGRARASIPYANNDPWFFNDSNENGRLAEFGGAILSVVRIGRNS